MTRLAGKVAIVTGAGQGIGRGIALAFAAEGASVVLAEIREDTGASVEAEIRARGGAARFIRCDVAQRHQIDACVAATRSAHGRIDVLVNNAVRFASQVPFLEQSENDFRLDYETDVIGTVNFMKACHPALAVRGGSIINLGSAAGYQGHANLASYAACKEAIRAVTRVAAREWGALGIRANVLCPFGASPGWGDWERADPQGAQAFIAARPLGRIGDLERDIGRAAVFLASDDSVYVTGMTLPVDGGGALVG